MNKNFITVTEGMNGFFAVEMWFNDEDNFPDEEENWGYWEPYQRGFHTHPTREKAEVEARRWAEDMEMEYRD